MIVNNDDMEIMHIANAGFLLKHKGIAVLIDGMHCAEHLIYETMNKALIEDILNGEAPFGVLDALIFTHSHGDHFDVDLTLDYLEKYKETVIIASVGVIALIKHHKRFDAIELKVGLMNRLFCSTNTRGYCYRSKNKPFRIKAMDFVHQAYTYNEKRNLNYENVGYIIDIDGSKVLHLGDAEIRNANFEGKSLIDENIDVALLNFPFLTMKYGRKLVEHYIKPKKIGYMHLPIKEKDDLGWNNQAEYFYDTLNLQEQGHWLFNESIASNYLSEKE